jgi:hypothetical protein
LIEILDTIFIKQGDNIDNLRLAKAQDYVKNINLTLESKIAYFKLIKDFGDDSAVLDDLKVIFDVDQLPDLSLPNLNRPDTFMKNLRTKIGTDYVGNYFSGDDIYQFLRKRPDEKLSIREVYLMNQSYKNSIDFTEFVSRPEQFQLLKNINLGTLDETNFLERILNESFIITGNKFDQAKELSILEYVEFYEQVYQQNKFRIKELYENIFLKRFNLEPTDLRNFVISKIDTLEYGNQVKIVSPSQFVYFDQIKDVNKYFLFKNSENLSLVEKTNQATQLLAERFKKVHSKYSCS